MPQNRPISAGVLDDARRYQLVLDMYPRRATLEGGVSFEGFAIDREERFGLARPNSPASDANRSRATRARDRLPACDLVFKKFARLAESRVEIEGRAHARSSSNVIEPAEAATIFRADEAPQRSEPEINFDRKPSERPARAAKAD